VPVRGLSPGASSASSPPPSPSHTQDGANGLSDPPAPTALDCSPTSLEPNDREAIASVRAAAIVEASSGASNGAQTRAVTMAPHQEGVAVDPSAARAAPSACTEIEVGVRVDEAKDLLYTATWPSALLATNGEMHTCAVCTLYARAGIEQVVSSRHASLRCALPGTSMRGTYGASLYLLKLRVAGCMLHVACCTCRVLRRSRADAAVRSGCSTVLCRCARHAIR
jgi:hypothetical protein